MTEPAGDETVNAAVVFADLAGFAAFTEAHGDIAAADIADLLVAVANSALGNGDQV
ncbi:MAG: hypothetical protein ACM4D3_04880 [Candidatus Sericytochromatia bacterium]